MCKADFNGLKKISEWKWYFPLFSSTRNFIRGHKETVLWWLKIIFGVVSHRTGNAGFQTSVVIVCAALSMQRPYHKDAPASITQRRTYRSGSTGTTEYKCTTRLGLLILFTDDAVSSPCCVLKLIGCIAMLFSLLSWLPIHSEHAVRNQDYSSSSQLQNEKKRKNTAVPS